MMSRRWVYLREMGLAPIWRLRHRSAGESESAPSAEEEKNDAAPPVEQRPKAHVLEFPKPKPHPVPGLPPEPSPPLPIDGIDTMGWPELEESIRACQRCVLCKKRIQAVPGVGDQQARWMFVGEGPGEHEDRRGEPFVGPAGQLLDQMLAAIGLHRSKGVYIANAVKCRPPHNRTPEAAEIATCLPFLDRQIALIQPKLLIALGRPAAQALLGHEIKIASARKKRFERGGIPVVVTYHPAYLLRNPNDKGKAWEDLCFIRSIFG